MNKLFIATVGLLLIAHSPAYAQGGKDAKDAKPQGDAAKQAPSALEGTQWTIKLTPDKAAAAKGEKAIDDTLVFADNKVTSTACTAHGFTASAYTVTKTATGWSFKTEQMSPKEGKTSWTGDVTDKNFKGKVVWTKKDNSVVNYDFEGTKAEAKKDDKKDEKKDEKKKEEPAKEHKTDKPADHPKK